MNRALRNIVLAAIAALLLGAESETRPATQPAKPVATRPATAPSTRPELKEIPPVQTDNTNALVLKHREKLQLSASTFWPTWEAAKAFDVNMETSWFSASGDAAALGKKPWVAASFPEDVTVRRVTILGNREPRWLKGYTILAGKLELFDKDGKCIHSETNEGLGNFRDFDFKIDKPLAGVRCVRFTSLGDEGNLNPYRDIAIAEVQIE